MASQDYYAGSPHQNQNYGQSNAQYQSSSSAPYYTPYDAASTTSSYPPSYAPYSSQQHLTGAPQRPPQSVSPFETVFDDHVYPAGQAQQGASTQKLPQDTGYHGLARTPSEDAMMSNQDGIPLQHRPPKDLDGTDHVYEAPQRKKTRRGKVPFGELGMFGAGKKKIPFVVYLFTIVQIAVFIGEVVRNAQLTGTPIMIKPQFNPMIGPSPYVLINMGARFTPCMHNLTEMNNYNYRNISWPCPNTTTNDANTASNQCTLSKLCGFGGFGEPDQRIPPQQATPEDLKDEPIPNQWFRFIVPMFMHAGLIHIGFNLLLQMTLGRDMEKTIGSIRFFLVYVSAGIFGFVLSANYAGDALASTGASGSLFGVIALTLLDLLYSWKDRKSPLKDLLFIFLDIAISFVLGLLPGLDNFAHIGGFLMGLALGISVLHSPNALRRRIGEDSSYASVNAAHAGRDAPSFFRSPLRFFKGRKPLWWVWWVVRASAVILVIVVFIVLLNNFYVYHKTCSWCKYLSCIDVNDWCSIGTLKLENDGGGNTKRDLLLLAAQQISKRLA